MEQDERNRIGRSLIDHGWPKLPGAIRAAAWALKVDPKYIEDLIAEDGVADKLQRRSEIHEAQQKAAMAEAIRGIQRCVQLLREIANNTQHTASNTVRYADE